jgi:2-polyprenyl-3-methyl-5-hydroxy-6-metoxy-1,4-benzoquinol methylase
MSEENREEQLRQSWNQNAVSWTNAVRCGQIPSRRSGTDAAILNAIYQFPNCRILDLGSGEGWLARVLNSRGYDVVGVDASALLVEEAARTGGGRFVCMSMKA